MSDNTTVEAQPEVESTDEPESFDADYVKKLREEAARYRVQAKDNAGAAERLAEIEESQKTETQRAAEKIAQLEKENTTFKQRERVALWSDEITKDSRIPAAALRGETEDELKAHFEQLLSLVPEPASQSTVVPGMAEKNSLALNSSGIEDALKKALGI